MSNVLIFSESYINEDEIAANYVSSEQAAFPVDNLYNAQRRSKVWRSNGYFNITSENNTIVFDDTPGAQRTATVAVGEYTSLTALLAAVETALEDQSLQNYTVEVDSATSRVKITPQSTSNDTSFYWTLSTMSDILGFDDSSDDINQNVFLADEIRNNSEEFVKWDMGLPVNPTGFFAITKRNEPIRISPDAVIKLQGNETDEWSDPSYSTTIAYHENCLSVIDLDGLHTEPLRWWRFVVIDVDNPLGFVELGSIFLGAHYTPTRGGAQFPLGSELTDASVTTFSEGGQSFSDIRPKSQRFSIRWFGLKKDELEEMDLIFDQYGTSRNLFVHFDPDGAFSTDPVSMIRYVKFESQPTFELVSPNNFTMTMNFREEL